MLYSENVLITKVICQIYPAYILKPIGLFVSVVQEKTVGLFVRVRTIGSNNFGKEAS